MLRRVLKLVIVLGCAGLLLGCRQQAQTGKTDQTNVPAAAPRATATRALPAPAQPPAGQEELVVTVTLPPRGEKLATETASGRAPACPKDAVSTLLGVRIVMPHGMAHGLGIGKVLPDGLGAKAGLKRGDMVIKVNGEAITCPRSLLPYLQRSDKPVEVELTIVRRVVEAKTAEEAGKPEQK
jgi:hypothetical protein